MTPEQLAAFIDFCRGDLPDYDAYARAEAVALVVLHLHGLHTPARLLPEMLEGHGYALMAQAVDELLTYGAILLLPRGGARPTAPGGHADMPPW